MASAQRLKAFERRFASYTNANSNKGNMVFSEKVFFLTLERIMTGQVNEHSNSFWEYIMFYTYVQDIVRQPTEIAKDTPKRDLVPVMKAENVTTIISDSGVTRFRISTPRWMVYDKTKEP